MPGVASLVLNFCAGWQKQAMVQSGSGIWAIFARTLLSSSFSSQARSFIAACSSVSRVPWASCGSRKCAWRIPVCPVAGTPAAL